MLGLPSILSLFHKELNKFKNTRTQMLNSEDHMILEVPVLANTKLKILPFYYYVVLLRL